MKKVIPDGSVLIPDNASKVFSGTIFDVYQWQQQLFDSSQTTFEMLKRADTVVVICVVDDKILVLDDEQPHNGAIKSFPGGRIESSDNSPQAAAEREVLEETGYQFNQCRLIKVNQPSRKIEWFVHLFVAWDIANQAPPTPDKGEKIKSQLLDFDEVKQLVMTGTGYLGGCQDIFENLNSTGGLLNLKDYGGQTVDR